MVKKIVIRHEEIQIVFKSDPELKDAALEKAKHEGMTLKAVLCSAMRAYVNDELVMGMTRREEQYDQEEDLPNEKSPPIKAEKIKGGIKSPLRRTSSSVNENKLKMKNEKGKTIT
ncbi:MAG: hypothetical protein WCT49_05830 [Candidatus Paceibacterota bacterium]|jgi:hypothetical protein|nr:hypothetical protein [Candidatus Paceibacterota bacterium]